MMSGYICPRCRLLVSASVELLGADVSCPGCRSIIQIPGFDDPLVLVEPVLQAVGTDLHAHKNISSENWRDDLPLDVLSARAKGLPWLMLLPVFGIASVLLASLIYVLFFTHFKPIELAQQKLVPEVESRGQISNADKVPTYAELETLLTKLSQAKSPGELRPMLREVPELEAKLANYYKGSEFTLSEPVDVIAITEIRHRTGFYLFRALLEGAEKWAGVVTKNTSGMWVIDWESYVGYCDIAWDELPKIRPKEPSVVRVARRKNEYYNQGFSSREWQSFELTYPNSDTILIGYASRRSALVQQLLPIGNRFGLMDVTLKIHYPENVNDPRLVIIDEVVTNDWITPNEK